MSRALPRPKEIQGWVEARLEGQGGDGDSWMLWVAIDDMNLLCDEAYP